MHTVRERVSLNLQARDVDTQGNRSAELKAEGVVDKDNTEEAEAIIKEGVQAALDKLEEY